MLTMRAAAPQCRQMEWCSLAAWNPAPSDSFQEWARLRHDEIVANWERARKNEPLLAIQPLP
jgi:hypothetical protein